MGGGGSTVTSAQDAAAEQELETMSSFMLLHTYSKCTAFCFAHRLAKLHVRLKRRGYVQGDYVGFNTGNGEKRSYSRAVQASCLAVALFLSISGVESYVVTLYIGHVG